MSKLSIIRKTLEEKAVIVHTEEEKLPLELCLCLPHKLTFCIAPKEPMYKADEMNKFMDSLFTGIEPTYRSYFRQDKCFLYTGCAYFDEQVGYSVTRIEKDIIITEKDAVNANEKLHSFNVNPINLMKRILVLPYPSKDIAEEIVHHNLPRWKIPMELIWKYHDERNFLLKILGRLHHKH